MHKTRAKRRGWYFHGVRSNCPARSGLQLGPENRQISAWGRRTTGSGTLFKVSGCGGGGGFFFFRAGFFSVRPLLFYRPPAVCPRLPRKKARLVGAPVFL